MVDFEITVQEQRKIRYRQTSPVHTAPEALAFINEVGFCLFCRHERLELPNLRDATAGSPETRESLNWQWKDEWPLKKQVYYGKPFRRKPGFVALDLLAPLYAVSPIVECGGDHLELYRRGVLSAEAKRIAETILEKGPLSTRDLKRESGLAGKKHKNRFARGLEQAQANFLVVRVGLTGTTRANYGYVWDSFDRFLPEIVNEARGLSREAAATTLVSRYVTTVVAATTEMIARIFPLGQEHIHQVASSLVASDVLGNVTHNETNFLVNRELLSLIT